MTLHAFYEGLGVLVKRNLIDVSLVENLFSQRIMWHYERYKSSIIEARARGNQSTRWKLVFHLYNHGESTSISFDLFKEYYSNWEKTHRVSSEIVDSKSFIIASGNNIKELDSGTNLFTTEIDLRLYRLRASGFGNLWWGLEERNASYVRNAVYLETENIIFKDMNFWS